MREVFCLLFLLCGLSQYSYSQKLDLDIVVSGIKEVKGRIKVGVYHDAAGFPKVGKEYRVEYFAVVSKEVTAKIKGLPHGEYSVALFQDVNNDGICNLNFVGIPKEPYGFSNNIKPIISAPSFEETRIVLNTNKTIRIKLID